MKNLNDFWIADQSTLLQAVEKIQRNESRAIMVTRNGVVSGVISEGDVMRALLRGVSVHAPVRELAHSSFKYLQAADRRAAFDICRKHEVTMVPVVDQEFRLVDVITLQELLASIELP